MTPVHPIETESYRRLAARVHLGHLPPITRAVVERVIHATADLSFADSLVVDEDIASRAVMALGSGAPVITDVEMVRVGISGIESRCYLPEARAARHVTSSDPDEDEDEDEDEDVITLSALAMRMAASEHREGAIFAIGCAPTALDELIALATSGEVAPLLVIGVPVGFVGAAQSKDRLRSLPAGVLPSISNVGERGGSAVAAAIVNALVRLSGENHE